LACLAESEMGLTEERTKEVRARRERKGWGEKADGESWEMGEEGRRRQTKRDEER
jgi:hypothetical protein